MISTILLFCSASSLASGYYLENLQNKLLSDTPLLPCELQMTPSTYWAARASDFYRNPTNYDKRLLIPVNIVCTGSRIEHLDPSCKKTTTFIIDALEEYGRTIEDIMPLHYNVTKLYDDAFRGDPSGIELRFIENPTQHLRFHRCPFGEYTLAHAGATYVHFNMKYDFDIGAVVPDDPDRYLFANTITHELGHSMGLPHSARPESIMFSESIFNYRLFLDMIDKIALRMKYQSVRDVRKENQPNNIKQLPNIGMQLDFYDLRDPNAPRNPLPLIPIDPAVPTKPRPPPRPHIFVNPTMRPPQIFVHTITEAPRPPVPPYPPVPPMPPAPRLPSVPQIPQAPQVPQVPPIPPIPPVPRSPSVPQIPQEPQVPPVALPGQKGLPRVSIETRVEMPPDSPNRKHAPPYIPVASVSKDPVVHYQTPSPPLAQPPPPPPPIAPPAPPRRPYVSYPPQ